jgi:hypothetical protein
MSVQFGVITLQGIWRLYLASLPGAVAAAGEAIAASGSGNSSVAAYEGKKNVTSYFARILYLYKLKMNFFLY